jgi:ribonucleoside-diphosphate reductase alpha chain
MLIKEHGIRNAVMLTAAPTGTVSMVHGASTGIEPIFAPMYNRRYREGNTWKSQMVLDPMFKEALVDGGDGRHIVGSYDITPEQHMAVQACIQKYVDNAISKTINLPNDANHEVVSKMALKFAPYLKGMTVYRAGSKGMEPLEALPLTDENIAKAKQLVATEQAEAERVMGSCTIDGECGA